MASIFLSYARDDRKRAEQVAQGLDAAGHKVWWDRHIHAGSRFNKEIDAALRSADLVMVLWSKSSVDSAWVHDEAAAGRDSGRLVPVLIEPVEPPLGFRQYQGVDLIGRRSQNDAAVGRLVAAVAERLGAAAPPPGLEKRRFEWLQQRRVWGVMAALLLLVAGGAWWLSSSRANPQSLVVAATDPASKGIAKDIAADLTGFRFGPLAGLDVRSGARDRAHYRAEVSLVRAGPQSELRLSFGSDKAPALWTAKFNGTGVQEGDLRLQAVLQLGAVLACAIDPKVTSAKLNDKLLRAYLTGCAKMGSASDSIDPSVIENFRQVTLEAPKFAPAWGQLELAQFRALVTAPGPEQHDLAVSTRSTWQQATKLDPNMPQNFIVHAFVERMRPNFIPNALAVIEKGLKANPDSALLLSTRADLLTAVGRLDDAFESANAAIWNDPLSPNLLESHVLLLVYTGQKAEAENELMQAERKWPGAPAITSLRGKFDFRYGDPRHARADDPSGTAYLTARADPSPANVQSALSAARARYSRSGDGLFLLQALATFNRTDEAYELLSDRATLENLFGNTDLLFRPYFKSIRDDPRFIDLAYRTGLLSFWRKSQIWPDFCSDPQLPYDCRKEAAKYPLKVH